MSMRRQKKGSEVGFSSLSLLFRRVAAGLVAGDDRRSVWFLERLEPRTLMSAAHVAAPSFMLFHPAGTAHSAAAASPTGLSPASIRSAYDIDQISFGPAVGDGAGQTIAIVDAYDDPAIVSDLHAFDVRFGMSDPALVRIGQTGTSTLPGTDPSGPGDSWAVEISLDVEWAHAAAPSAKIVLVEAKSDSTADLFAAVDTARKYAGVSVVSMSWGTAEYSGQSSYDSYFTTPSGHNGVTFVASSGDSGAYASSPRTRSVEYPAVSPNVLSVGGTTLSTSGGGAYLSESGWGYGAWSYYYGGSGGGISQYVRQPTWQNGVVTQSASFRTVPDVSFDADPDSGVAIYDSWDSSSQPWMQVGGTSLAAPVWAGLIAIANQGRAVSGLPTLDGAGQTLPDIYSLPAGDFHDITTGNNGYSAGPGYDLVTGRGTPVANLLVAGLAGTSQTPQPTQPTKPTIESLSVSPASVTAGAGTIVTLSAGGVQETSGTISSVAFYRESDNLAGLQIGSDTPLGDGTAGGTTWTLPFQTSPLPAGTYTFYAVATDATGVSGTVASTTLTVLAAAPANDNFAGATVLSGSTVTITGTNVNATKEPGEPNHAGNIGGKSVWYTWTAPAGGRVSINTHGSSFDTLLGVYTGNTVSGLTTVAGNDDDRANHTLTSAVAFNAVKGTTYRIAVDGYNGASGAIVLNLSLAVAPANDAFAGAAVLTGRTFTWTGTNAGATREAGEPYITNNFGGASVWFSWTAPTTRTVTLTTSGSDFDTMLGVYTGGTVSNLTLVAQNDDALSGWTLTSALTFNAVAGTTYHFAVDGYNGATGDIVLNMA